MKPKLIVLAVVCLVAKATAFAATGPVVEIRGAFAKVTVADAIGRTPDVIYFRQDAIVSIEVRKDGSGKEKALPVYVTVTTSAISTEGTNGSIGISKSYQYRFPDEASASRFCEALVGHSRG
jgi:hypothetical protein